MITTMKNDYLTVSISSKGAEIKSVQSSSGEEFIWCGDPDVWQGQAPVLFPICGGLKDDKYILNGKEYSLEKHGFARHLEFDCEKSTDSETVFCLKDDEDTRAQFPYKFEFRIIYTLDKNSIKVSYDVKNMSDSTMYYSVGAHEGYACPEGIEEYSILFDTPQSLNSYVLHGNLLGDDYISVTENSDILPLDYKYFAIDALVFKNVSFNKVTLAQNDGSRKITVEFPEHDYFLLWTKPNAKYICLEPWHGVPDSVNSSYDFIEKEGIIALNPGESKTIWHRITFDI